MVVLVENDMRNSVENVLSYMLVCMPSVCLWFGIICIIGGVLQSVCHVDVCSVYFYR